MIKYKNSNRDFDQNINSTVYKKERRKELRCPFCPPNKDENAKDRFKYGKPTKPKKKNKR